MAHRVNLKRILHVLGEQLHVTGEIETETLTVGDVSFRFREPIAYDVTFTNTGGGIVANGHASALVGTECSRCLVEFDSELSGAVEGFYVLPETVDSLPAEQEFELIEDEHVDLEPAVLASLAVDAPFAPLHDPECQGICPLCGCDRNLEECTCEEEKPASPFDVLKGMFAENDGGDADTKDDQES